MYFYFSNKGNRLKVEEEVLAQLIQNCQLVDYSVIATFAAVWCAWASFCRWWSAVRLLNYLCMAFVFSPSDFLHLKIMEDSKLICLVNDQGWHDILQRKLARMMKFCSIKAVSNFTNSEHNIYCNNESKSGSSAASELTSSRLVKSVKLWLYVRSE